MAQFYGTIKGQRGEASRLGSKASGLGVRAASWQGAIDVRLWHDEKTGKDMYDIEQVTHHGAGICQTLARGVVGEYATFADCLKRSA